jgi:hypothetical protein
MKFKIIILTIALICVFLCGNVSAYDYEQTPMTYVEPPVFDFNDSAMSGWMNEAGDLDTWLIVTSCFDPYKMIFGDFIFIFLYMIYLFLIWGRSNSLFLVAISIGITYPLFLANNLLPLISWWIPPMIFVVGVSAMLFKLFKRRG